MIINEKFYFSFCDTRLANNFITFIDVLHASNNGYGDSLVYSLRKLFPEFTGKFQSMCLCIIIVTPVTKVGHMRNG
jgi:hypothetical protein